MRLYLRAGARMRGLGRSNPPGLATGPSHLLLKESTEASTEAHKHLYNIRSHEYLTDPQAGATSHEVSGEPQAQFYYPSPHLSTGHPPTQYRPVLISDGYSSASVVRVPNQVNVWGFPCQIHATQYRPDHTVRQALHMFLMTFSPSRALMS